MRMWLMVDKMISMKRLFDIIIYISAMLMLFICHDIWIRGYLRNYMNMSMQGSGVATFDAALLALTIVAYVIPFTSVYSGFCMIRPALLYLYGAFLAVAALLNFVLLGAGALVVYRTNLNEGFDQGLNESMAAYGQDDSKSSHIDTMQSTLQCCGNRGKDDWLNLDPPKKIPLSCHGFQNKFIIPHAIYSMGCYNLVLNFMNGKFRLVAGTVIGTTLCLLIGSFLSCCIASNINKVKQGVRCKETDLHTKDHICLIHIWNKTVCAVPKSGKVTDEVRQKELLCP